MLPRRPSGCVRGRTEFTMPGFASRRRRLPALISAAALAAITSPVALGGGIEVPKQNARAAGQADAFIAQADDPSPVGYNPAGLTQVEGTQIIVGGVELFMNWDFDADAGADQSMNSEALLPHVYLSSDLGT